MYRRQKKIPTIIAIFILFFGIVGVVYLDSGLHIFSSKAKEEIRPEDFHFSNITDSSFSLSWLTAQPEIGEVLLAQDSHSITYLDDLDSDNIPRPRTTHHVTIKNLSENTSYTAKIISGNTKCSNQYLCPTFTQKTAPKLFSPLALPPVRGTAILTNKSYAEAAVVYLSIGKSALLSGRVDSAGLWVIPLTFLRTQDLIKNMELSDNDIVQITIKLSPAQQAQVLIDVKSIKENLSIPPVQMGNSYNFINLISKKNQLANLNNQRTLGVQNQLPTPTPKIDILFPKEEGDTTTDSLPRFRGIGIPGKEIVITINSAIQTSRLIVGPEGTWIWRPTRELAPGTHSITIQGYDETGRPTSITRKFIVLKSGEGVLGEATPAATLTPTSSPTNIPTSPPSIIPSRTPTPTIELVTSPTVAIPPKTGVFQPTLFLFSGGAILLLLGAKLLLL
jgi:hypothetical protein